MSSAIATRCSQRRRWHRSTRSSSGRLILGVAAGYLRPEFAALGADFERRNELLDEGIETLKLAWSGATVVASGADWRARGATVLPRPVQTPHPPIWCGGNSTRAMRRSVDKGDGWMPFATSGGLGRAVRTAEIASVEDLAGRLTTLDRLCEEYRRAERPTICFGLAARPTDRARFDDELCRAEEIGVDWISITLPCASRAEWSDAVADLAQRFRPSRPS